ncbi:Protein unc-93 like protein [Argiope bruennichi]|uniref:Protein unc-93 like protein n=1 Tax=Argiope bruennichi TaxID=94029 RepID=A0A8T0F9Q3_ARGBR|nr:Protein unc-93 like protein [Argiope bruennichi]
MPQLLEPSCRDISLEDLTAEYKPISNLRVIRNLVVLSVGCLMAFCSYDGLVMLQSTINQESGIGVISVAVQFSFSCITALLLPEYLFEKIGCKSVIVICLISFVPYIASNFYPHWSLMIPSSILLGLANSLYWAAESAYLNHLSILYSSNLKRNKIAASTKKCNKRSDEKIGDQEVNMNAQILNKCVSDCARVLTDINKELKETVLNNKM